MQPVVVNLSQWRTDHMEQLYAVALVQAESPVEPDFILMETHWGQPCVRIDRHDPKVVRVSFSCSRIGSDSSRKQTDLQLFAKGRMIDDGSFGQLAKSLVLALEQAEINAARTLPRWARELQFMERPEAGEHSKTFERIRKRSNKLGLPYFARHEHISDEDVPALLRYAIYSTGKRHDTAIETSRKTIRERIKHVRATKRSKRRYDTYLHRLLRGIEKV